VSALVIDLLLLPSLLIRVDKKDGFSENSLAEKEPALGVQN